MIFADTGLALAALLVAAWVSWFGVRSMRARTVRAATGWTAVLTAIGAVLFASQAAVVDVVEDARVPGVADQAVLTWFVGHRAAPLTAVARLLDLAGGTAAMATLAGAAMAALLIRGHRAEAATVFVGTLGAATMVVGFKTLYARDRPPVTDRLITETGWSLPSGHALGSAGVIGLVAAVAVLLVRRHALRVGIAAVAAVGVLAVGTSRLYLGVHWLTDVLTGWLLGAAWVAVCIAALVTVRRGQETGESDEAGPGMPVVRDEPAGG